jgi:hypothetical protein
MMNFFEWLKTLSPKEQAEAKALFAMTTGLELE